MSLPEAVDAAARPECEHYWAHHCYDGLSVRLCQLCHEPDWADVRQQQAEAAAAERERLAAVIPAARFRQLADWFDTDDEFKVAMFPETWSPRRAHDVQDDLRKFADALDEPPA